MSMMSMERLSEEERMSFALIVARSWEDDEFATAYAQDPRATLAAYGIECGSDEEAPALPARPDLELSVVELTASGAATPCGGTTFCSNCGGCGCA